METERNNFSTKKNDAAMEQRNKLISCIEETGHYHQIIKIIVSKHAIFFLSKSAHYSAINKNSVFFKNAWI